MKNEECRMLGAAASRITHHVSPFALEAPAIPHSALRTPHSQRGVALVITLILLAVITFMAITFLVVSTAERGSVTTQTDLSIARLAADTARDRAIVEVLAPLLATGNEFNYGLLVSTNFINPGGFTPGVFDPLNVNYDYTITGTSLGANDALLNMANLYYNPRPPVFVVTNSFTGSNEFRYYLDWNRNRMFDPTGWLALTNSLGEPTGETGWMVGDPQWIGMPQRPEFPHSATNLFASRYAYFVVPIGQTLDINAIHNSAKPFSLNRTSMAGAMDGFFRNQGILPSEINLAAFLADLNTNLWPFPGPSGAPFGFSAYVYDPYDLNLWNRGAAFDDAVGVLTYRYNQNYKSLASVFQLFGPAGSIAFTNPIDGYLAGPLMTGTSWPANPNTLWARRNSPWSGAYNPNAFFSTQDLFDENKTAANIPAGSRPTAWTLTKRLAMASTNTDSYNRDTFARLSAQLGTYSAPEPDNKLNLNYRNVDDYGYVVPGMATNFMAWEPTLFFTNVAIRLLVDAGYTVAPLPTNGTPAYYSTSNLLVEAKINGVLVTNLNIPVWPTNLYTPSVHRLFQLAANIYDGTTNRADYAGSDPLHPLPTVFRPIFTELARNQAGQRQVFVVGYSELTVRELSSRFNSITGITRPLDLSDPSDDTRALQPSSMVYNVPLVIGAKKGLPSFVELTMDTDCQAARKLIYQRDSAGKVNSLAPAYFVTVTNIVGLQAWNAYTADFNRPVTLYAWPESSVLLTNLDDNTRMNPQPYFADHLPLQQPLATPIPIWPGYQTRIDPITSADYSFVTPLGPQGGAKTNYTFVRSNSVYSVSQRRLVENAPPNANLAKGVTNYTGIPHIQVTFKGRLRFALVDQQTQRLIDYVNLATSQTVDMTTNMADNCNPHYSQQYSRGGMWCTNVPTGGRIPAGTDPRMPFGVRLQVDVSAGTPRVGEDVWATSLPNSDYRGLADHGITKFKKQFGLGAGTSDNDFMSTFSAPFSPVRNLHIATCWMANDPLVHYTVGDLQDLTDFPKQVYLDEAVPDLPPTGYKQVNKRYEPWGGRALASEAKYDWRLKDPLPRNSGRSDDWDFPTNKLPNVGWLGRIHRGTPWQTIYLKALGLDYPSWIKWSGNDLMVTNYGQLPWTNMPQLSWVSTTNGGVVTTRQEGYDSAFSQPTNDWRLLDIFTTALSPNATRGRLSINQPNLAAWSAVLSGVIVLSNAQNGALSPAVIQPAGTYDATAPVNTWPAVARIVNGINFARTNLNAKVGPVFANQAFHRLGDLLSVPELTSASPFLSIGSPGNARPTPPMPNDAAFERIPQQILGLLKCDPTPRVAIYAFGQTLKPAPRSRVTSGPYFGMVTNYQITAEVATRAVVRFDGVPAYLYGTPSAITNLHPVIESFNVLPPE